jgi:hypothetical protein
MIATLQKEGQQALAALQGQVQTLPGIEAEDVAAALQFFADNAS